MGICKGKSLDKMLSTVTMVQYTANSNTKSNFVSNEMGSKTEALHCSELPKTEKSWTMPAASAGAARCMHPPYPSTAFWALESEPTDSGTRQTTNLLLLPSCYLPMALTVGNDWPEAPIQP